MHSVYRGDPLPPPFEHFVKDFRKRVFFFNIRLPQSRPPLLSFSLSPWAWIKVAVSSSKIDHVCFYKVCLHAQDGIDAPNALIIVAYEVVGYKIKIIHNQRPFQK